MAWGNSWSHENWDSVPVETGHGSLDSGLAEAHMNTSGVARQSLDRSRAAR
jgi:nitroreductase